MPSTLGGGASSLSSTWRRRRVARIRGEGGGAGGVRGGCGPWAVPARRCPHARARARATTAGELQTDRLSLSRPRGRGHLPIRRTAAHTLHSAAAASRVLEGNTRRTMQLRPRSEGGVRRAQRHLPAALVNLRDDLILTQVGDAHVARAANVVEQQVVVGRRAAGEEGGRP
eukprot:5555545-Prymnesium_polylepis.1